LSLRPPEVAEAAAKPDGSVFVDGTGDHARRPKVQLVFQTGGAARIVEIVRDFVEIADRLQRERASQARARLTGWPAEKAGRNERPAVTGV